MSLFSSGKPQSLNSLVRAQFEAGERFLTGSPSIQDLRILGYTQYCGSTSDCGYGSQCVDGLCRPIGNGNTQYGEDGCSSGSSTPPATLDCITCGYDGERSCAGTRSCTFTPYGVTCRCGQSSNNGNDGNGGEEGKPCNKYCTTEYASYGSYSGGCSYRNTCTECYSCEGGDANNGNCTKKSRGEGAPCHCDPPEDGSCEPRDEVAITCCSYRDTCAGRVEGTYCHETYRTFYPRCYDPDYPDCSGPQPTDQGCIECTYGTVSWNPNQSEPVLDEEGAFPCSEGCAENEVECTDPVSGNCFCRECCPKYGGNDELINDDTGDTITFIECCKNTCPGEPGCSSSMDCNDGQCCNNGACGDCCPNMDFPQEGDPLYPGPDANPVCVPIPDGVNFRITVPAYTVDVMDAFDCKTKIRTQTVNASSVIFCTLIPLAFWECNTPSTYCADMVKTYSLCGLFRKKSDNSLVVRQIGNTITGSALTNRSAPDVIVEIHTTLPCIGI